MRSERREEERKQRAAARGNRFFQVLSVIYTLILAAFIGLLIWINVLPAKYLYSLIAVLVLISIFIVPVMFSRYGIKKRKTAAPGRISRLSVFISGRLPFSGCSSLSLGSCWRWITGSLPTCPSPGGWR